MVPFGFTNAPATFMCLGNNVFRRYLDKCVLVFLDDTLTYSKNEEELLEQSRLILKLIKKHTLYEKLRKCELYEDRTHCLGHIISDKGIYVDLEKIEAMRSWPDPRKLTDVKYFVGLAGYYRRLIEEYFTGELSLCMG